jgi:hypothetical protein
MKSDTIMNAWNASRQRGERKATFLAVTTDEQSLQCRCRNTNDNDKEVFEGLIKYSVSAGEECKNIQKANIALYES